ncbi:MAG TPA: fumarylacetoacetate hydrolase family protein [Burkholderiales bacterium]|nr:fumarylacetoacetate hydrolase family protein [Burkholderiales bacterium]
MAAASDIDSLADEIMVLHQAGAIVAPFSERYSWLSAPAGYRAAARLHALRLALGWKPLGRKIGFTNRTIWPRYGVYQPMWGTVYDRTVIFAQADRATVSLAGLAQPRIEPEICFGLKAAPAVTHDADALLGAIEWVAHSVEIVQCHHPDWKLKIADCTADNGLHGRLVVGTPIPVRDLAGLGAKLPALRVELRKGEAVVDRGVGANVLGSPLEALAFLVEILSQQADAPPLVAGEIVSTGTLTDAHPVAPGETWSTAFEGLPLKGLQVSFE